MTHCSDLPPLQFVSLSMAYLSFIWLFLPSYVSNFVYYVKSGNERSCVLFSFVLLKVVHLYLLYENDVVELHSCLCACLRILLLLMTLDHSQSATRMLVALETTLYQELQMAHSNHQQTSWGLHGLPFWQSVFAAFQVMCPGVTRL